VASLAAISLAVALPAPASASDSSFAVMFSDPGDYIGGGTQRLFRTGNASITLSGSPGYVEVSVSGGTSGDYYWMDFAAPPGWALSPGYYTHAQRAPFREAGRPGIDIFGSGRGCNEIDGLFQVKDIAWSGTTLTRLWILYEQHCEGGSAALFGEVRVGEPPATDPALLAPLTIRWPASDVGRASTTVPATLVALDSPVTISSASVVGANPGDYVIRADDCSGHTIPVGGSCQVWVRFIPAGAGIRSATLRLTGPATQRDVELQGFAFGGTTRVDMTSDPGDYIGQGQPWHYTFGNAWIGAGGGRQYAGFGVSGDDGSDWSAAFVPAAGDILAPGTYLNATRYPFNGTGPGMDVSGNGRGCNTLTGQFTVNSINFWSDMTLRSASITFEQHCEGATPALRGTFEFRSGDTTQLPPWMDSPLPPPGPPPPPVPPPPPPPGPPPPPPPGPTTLCRVPRVVRKPLSRARRMLVRAHCRVGRVKRVRSRSFGRGVVLAQKPRAGRKLHAGTRVNLTVSRGRR
jgi:PASTA domain